MHPLGFDHFSNVTVLCKQSHSAGSFAFEHAFQIFCQCKTGPLHFIGRFITALLGPLHKFLRQRFHHAHDLGRTAEAHHLQCANRLVQLLTGDAQMAGIQARQVGAARQICVAHKTAHRLGGTVQ